MLAYVVLLIFGAYLLGSVPTSYIAGRLLRGIDIRNYGSGSASGSNVWHTVGRWAIVPVGIFDILKGFIPVYIAWATGLTLWGDTVWVQGLAALAAMAGHSWSIFLRFDGGRGFATMMGSLILLGPWELLLFVGIWIVGVVVLKNSPLWMIFGAAAMPPVSLALPDEPLTLTWCLLGMVLLLVLKRLMADQRPPPGEWKRVLVYRLFLDRDTRNREDWIYRTPEAKQEVAK